MSTPERTVVAHLLGANTTEGVTPLELLVRLDTNPAKADSLATALGIDLTTVYRSLDPLQEWNFVTASDVGVYETSGLGAVIRTYLEQTTEAIRSESEQSALFYLFEAASRSAVLASIAESPADRAMLADRPNSPSKTTIHRTLTGLVEHGLIDRQHRTGHYAITKRGSDVLDTHETLIEGVEICRRHTVLFCCCGKRISDIPVLSLRDAEQIIDLETAPDRTMATLEEIVEEGITDLRALQSHVSNRLADIFDPVIQSDVPVELLLTARVFTELPTAGRYSENVRRGLQATNVSVRVVPEIESFPFGLSIINRDTVTLGPAHVGYAFDTPEGRKSESLVCRDPALVNWAETVYGEYKIQSRPPLQHIVKSLLERISQNVPFTDTETDSEA